MELTKEVRAAQKAAHEAATKGGELQKEVERITNEHTSLEKQWGKRRKQLEDELTDSHYQVKGWTSVSTPSLVLTVTHPGISIPPSFHYLPPLIPSQPFSPRLSCSKNSTLLSR